MDLSKFLLYYAILLQIIFCIYIFNPKMEWALMTGSFYVMVLFAYGITSELYKTSDQTNRFVDAFKSSKIIKAITESVEAATGLDIDKYIMYLIPIPAILNIATIKLVTNYEGNREIRKSKKRTEQLNNIKWLLLVSVVLYLLVTIIGFPLDYAPDIIIKATSIPLFAIPTLYLFSIANLVMAIYVWGTYRGNKGSP